MELERLKVPNFDIYADASIRTETLKVKEMENTVYLKLNGYLDTYNSINFQKQVNILTEAGYYRVIVDCSAVDYISSTGIGCFTELYKKCRTQGGDLVLIHLQKSVNEVFSLLGFSQFFVVKASLEDAVNYMKNHIAGEFEDVRKVQCPSCNRVLRVVKAGKFRCGNCKFVFTVTAQGKVSLD